MSSPCLASRKNNEPAKLRAVSQPPSWSASLFLHPDQCPLGGDSGAGRNPPVSPGAAPAPHEVLPRASKPLQPRSAAHGDSVRRLSVGRGRCRAPTLAPPERDARHTSCRTGRATADRISAHRVCRYPAAPPASAMLLNDSHPDLHTEGAQENGAALRSQPRFNRRTAPTRAKPLNIGAPC
jgi:hypothetical protein